MQDTPSNAQAGTAPLPASNATLIQTANQWVQQGKSVAIAMVMETWGSSPRPEGSLLVMTADGEMEGSVSGGCVEMAVFHAAAESLSSGKGQRLEYGVADSTAWQVGLSCGGRIAILLTPVSSTGLPAASLARLAAVTAARQPAHLILDSQSGAVLAEEAGAAQLPLSASSVQGGRFHLAVMPPPRLVIIGGVHISQLLAPLANTAGFDVVIIDPREHFASAARFGSIPCINDWPDIAIQQLGLDEETAVVTLTHDAKLDDPALIAALQSPAFYIACLGSRRTHAARLQRLAENGVDTDSLARLHGPAGLAIGARTPAEIAVSILAQMIGRRNLVVANGEDG